MSGARILVADDEAQLRRAVRRSLEGHGYDVREAEDGEAALREVQSFKPDVLLLDLMLPDMTGVDVCRALRPSYETPIIVLSVVGDDRAKAEALDAGADDYLTKPFSAVELLARVRVALRRGSTYRPQASVIIVGPLRMDLESREVTVEGQGVRLTPTEYSLLKHLALNAGRVLTNPMILRAVWGDQYAGDSHLLRTYINQLRSKLGEAGARLVRTDAGVGYRFTAPEEIS